MQRSSDPGARSWWGVPGWVCRFRSVLLAGGELSGLQRRSSLVNEVGDNGKCTVARVFQVQVYYVSPTGKVLRQKVLRKKIEMLIIQDIQEVSRLLNR